MYEAHKISMLDVSKPKKGQKNKNRQVSFFVKYIWYIKLRKKTWKKTRDRFGQKVGGMGMGCFHY